MQIVTLQQLKELANHQITESDLQGQKEFDEIVKLQNASYTSSRQNRMDEKDAMHKACCDVKRHVHFHMCPPVRFVGEGSSRISFAIDGGLCIKVAKNPAGKAQNKVEYKNCIAKPSFFPACYNTSEGFNAILVECCAPFTYKDTNDFKKALGFKDADAESIGDVFARANEFRKDDFKKTYYGLREREQAKTKDNRSYEEIKYRAMQRIEAIDRILYPSRFAQELLSKLALWCYVNPQKADPGDFGNIENWGMVVRKGKLVPVAIDIGFSPEVRDEFYS